MFNYSIIHNYTEFKLLMNMLVKSKYYSLFNLGNKIRTFSLTNTECKYLDG